MTDHIADLSKKVLSHTQIRAMAEIDGWKWGEYRFDGKWIGRRVPCSPTELASKRVRLADMSLPIDTDEDGDYPDFNDLNLAMGVLKRWVNDPPENHLRKHDISYNSRGDYMVVVRQWKIGGLPVNTKIGRHMRPYLPIAIAEALMQIPKES